MTMITTGPEHAGEGSEFVLALLTLRQRTSQSDILPLITRAYSKPTLHTTAFRQFTSSLRSKARRLFFFLFQNQQNKVPINITPAAKYKPAL